MRRSQVSMRKKDHLSNTRDQQIQTRILPSFGKSPSIHSLSAESSVRYSKQTIKSMCVQQINDGTKKSILKQIFNYRSGVCV